VPPESWVAEYRVFIKVLTYQWVANFYRGWKIFELKKKLHYRDAQALHTQLYDFWQCWKVFGTLRNPGREAFLASPAFHPIENAIPLLVTPKKLCGSAKDKMRHLRYQARLLVGTFQVACAVIVKVNERMLEHAHTPFVDIPPPPPSLPTAFPEIDEIDSIPHLTWPQQATTGAEEGEETEDNDEGMEEEAEQQDVRKPGGNEEFVKQSEESVSENPEPTVKEMKKDKWKRKEMRKDDGKVKEVEKDTEDNSMHAKQTVHRGHVMALLLSLLTDVCNRKPAAEESLKEASRQLRSDSLSEAEMSTFENSMLETLVWTLDAYGRGFEGYNTYRALYHVACRTHL